MRFVVNKRLICDDGLTTLNGSEQLARDQTVVYGRIVDTERDPGETVEQLEGGQNIIEAGWLK